MFVSFANHARAKRRKQRKPRRPDPAKRRRVGAGIKKAVLSLAAVVIVLVLAECVLRLLPPQQRGFRYEEGVFKRPLEYDYDKSSNSLGFHDVEPGARRPDVTRVLLLGDSYAAARFVSVPEGVGQRLQHHLNALSGQLHEVIVCGEVGWGPRQELDSLTELLPGLQPDLVVQLFLVLNDVRDCSEELVTKARQQKQEMTLFRPGWGQFAPDQAPLFFCRFSLLNQLVSYRLALLMAPRRSNDIPVDYFVYAEPLDGVWQTAFSDAEQLILQTREAARQSGAQYALVSVSTPHGVLGREEGIGYLSSAYPGMRDLAWNLDAPDARLTQFCRRNGIPFLALEPAFRQQTREHRRRLHYKHDGHWNAEGNDLAAELIAAWLLDR